MTNVEIASVFEHIALILNLRGNENPFRIRAYEKAALVIGNLSKDLRKVYDEGGLQGLQEIPGIGKDLALKIEEMLKTGKLKYLAEIEKKIPKGLLDMLEIEGMGPKKVKFVWEKFKVKSIPELEKLAKSGKLEKIKGWGAKSAANILRGIEMRSKVSGRLPLPVATEIVEALKKALMQSGLCQKIEAAGSYRRRRETVGDIDLLATSKYPDKLMDYFTKLPMASEVTGKGKTKSTIFLTAGLDADLRVVPKESFGAALLYFTGSKDHNVRIRRIGLQKGYTLNEYGLWKGTPEKKGPLVAAETEEDVYKAIGLRYVPPELREDRGEVEAAQKGTLPKLIELKDIQSDLHMHSTFSDGSASMEAMAKAAKDQGLSYIAMTDHASAMGMVKGIKKDGKNLKEYLDRVREARKKVPGIHILAGTEVDIDKDGDLYLPNSMLKEFDWVIASVHQFFHEPEASTTARLIKALSNPYVNVLGHPTARLLGQRSGIVFDIDAVLNAAKMHRKAMELNASFERLDLPDPQLKRAKELGVMISMGSDAHTTQGIELQYGISQAQRGWLEKANVLNTLPWEKFEAWRKK